ncbi:MAG: DUF4288 domain-containing protein [Angustibacter sp.]
MSAVWFSAMLRFVVLVEREGGTRRSRSVVVFRALDWPEAKQRALEHGRIMERSFAGGAGQQIRWRLEAIETLDLLGDTITDGREIYSEPITLPETEAIPFEVEFRPEASQPGQTGV